MSAPSVALFTTTIFASAFLIFLVQPMVGKHILPWFGGAPGVWALCLAFYQLALFLGYAYSHWLNDRLQPKRQIIVHASLFVAAIWVLPVLPDESWKPTGESSPSLHILSMLVANVGPPFLLLAATGPLIQAWFARVFPGRSPYRLYAVSNVGSLLALLSYPFLVEPQIALSAQSGVWSWAFAFCGLAVLSCGWLASVAARTGTQVGPAREAEPREANTAEAPIEIGATRVLLWTLLPACAVVLFMGVTNVLCLDVASIPFLWILPLAIYLITYIVCFGSERLYRRGVFASLAFLSVSFLISARVGAVTSLTMGMGASPIAALAALYLLALFFCCMLLHGELYRLRPVPERLTLYYMCISGGGAFGGLFVAIVAPQIFNEYYELPLGWLACLLLATLACLTTPGPLLRKRGAQWTLGVVVSVVAVVLSVMGVRIINTLNVSVGSASSDIVLLHQERNFFSIMRIVEVNPSDPSKHYVVMKHGTTSHGTQFKKPSVRQVPISYFGRFTGIGMVMHQRPDEAMNVGILGLGAGTLAAYGREGDRFRFYEIDPDVIRAAQNTDYFTYLSDSPSNIEVVLGDARLSLERELRESGSQEFDLLILDAFSSDSVPLHLITVEALELYVQHLKPAGVVAMHISNVNLSLHALVFRLAAELGMHAARLTNKNFPLRLQSGSEWMILSREAALIESFPIVAERFRSILKAKPTSIRVIYPEDLDLSDAPLFTDDYSDLFAVLKVPDWFF